MYFNGFEEVILTLEIGSRDLAQDRVQWRDYVWTIMNLRVP